MMALLGIILLYRRKHSLSFPPLPPSLPPSLHQDTDILPYALFTNMMALLGIIVYREAEPIQPQPQVRREGGRGRGRVDA